MAIYLIGMSFHEPEAWAQFQRGEIEDFESSTGLYVEALSPANAIEWAEKVAELLLRKFNDDETLNWKDMGYECWLETDADTSGWKHCLTFFQRVNVGEIPDINAMGVAAYKKWKEANNIGVG